MHSVRFGSTHFAFGSIRFDLLFRNLDSVRFGSAESNRTEPNYSTIRFGFGLWYTHSDDPQKMRSGKLKMIRFPREVKLETKMSETDPGSLGYSLYILRVTAIEVYHGKVKGSTATDVTDICKNEFGERSFPFCAPDGYFWTILEHVG